MSTVSIVTPSLNQAPFLPATLASVREQDYPHIEHLVMDGGSTDGSVEILRATPGLRWFSAPDRGQVDALNRGFALATGEILAWLNADDTLNPDCVRLAVAALERTGADLVYGDLDLVDEHGLVLRESRGIPFDRRILLYGINYIGQQTVFFRRSLLEKTGPLRAEFDNSFDYELWLRMAHQGRLVYEPRLRAQIRKHPAAKSIAAASTTTLDNAKIRQEYWRDGGLPVCLSRPPWFKIVNGWFRLRRQWQLRQTITVSGRPRVLMFGYLPPPQFGPATAYDALFQSRFPRRFAVSFVNLGLSATISDVQRFRWRKLARLVAVINRTVRLLAARRPVVACYPAAFNSMAFVKDALILLLVRSFRVPVVLWAHGNNLPAFLKQSPRWRRFLIRRTVHHARAAIVLGERLRFNFDGLLPGDRVLVCSLGIAAPPLPVRPSARAAGLTVLYLGNLIREKGVFVLLEAARRLPSVRFSFAGNWYCPADEAAARAQAGPNVEFLGSVAGPAKWQVLADADIFAFPTFYSVEAQPLVVVEALAAGLPVVTTARAAISEMITEGVNGVFVREQDAVDLAEKILQLAEAPALRDRMRAANQAKFRQMYTAASFGERMITIFQSVTGDAGRPHS